MVLTTFLTNAPCCEDIGQKRSKPVGKLAELLKGARYGRKRKAEAGEKWGDREKHVWRGPRSQVQIAGLEV